MCKKFPEHADTFQANAAVYLKELDDLEREVREKANRLPKSKRVLVTSHDAFNYFGRAHDFEVVGLQGISTVTEAGLADMARMVDLIKSRNIKAVFVESSVPSATSKRSMAWRQPLR